MWDLLRPGIEPVSPVSAGGFLTIEPPLLLLCSVMSDPLRPRRLQPARLFCPWIFQARILEWVAVSFFSRSSQLRDQTCISSIACVGRQILFPLCHLGSPILLLFVVVRQKSDQTKKSVRQNFGSEMLEICYVIFNNYLGHFNIKTWLKLSNR